MSWWCPQRWMPLWDGHGKGERDVPRPLDWTIQSWHVRARSLLSAAPNRNEHPMSGSVHKCMVVSWVLESYASIRVKLEWISPGILPTPQFPAPVWFHYVKLSNWCKLASTPCSILTYAVTWLILRFWNKMSVPSNVVTWVISVFLCSMRFLKSLNHQLCVLIPG